MRHIFKKFYLREFYPFQYRLLRPFIQFSRFELLKFCEFWHLPIYPDGSNFHQGLKRNRLRLFFLPYIKIFLNRNYVQKIYQIQKILDFENQYFQCIIQKLRFDQTSDFFPKVFQYRIFYNFLFSMKKKISFYEISCIFQKLQSKPNEKKVN